MAWGPPSVIRACCEAWAACPNLWMGLAWKVEVQDSEPSDPGSPEGPAPSLWEQKGGLSAGWRRACCLQPGFLQALHSEGGLRGARSQFPARPVPVRLPSSQGLRPRPSLRASSLQQEGGQTAQATPAVSWCFLA